MSVKVLSVSFPAQTLECTSGVPHIFMDNAGVFVTLLKADVKLFLIFRFKAGFKCDGASIPWAFRWFLPSWAEDGCGYDADIYNLGSSIHDALYIHGGFGLFDREECDDILRGIWRESGISRFKAGVADKAVEWFAGGDKHWKNDSYGVGNLVTMEF